MTAPIASGTGVKILVAGNDPSALAAMESRLVAEGYHVVTIPDLPHAAIHAFEQQGPDLVILDAASAPADAVRLCQYIKTEQRLTPYTPVVIVTVRTDLPNKAQWLAYGADVYLTKPVDPEELAASVTAAVRLKRAYNELRQLSIMDDLTGLFNRRYLFQAIEYELKRARRFGGPLSLLLMDLDHFKQVNDQHGHLFGDFVLREVARVLRANAKETDILARYGGEEFVLVCVETPLDGALKAADRLRGAVAGQAFRQADHAAQVTASIGLVSLPAYQGAGGDAVVLATEGLIAAADTALFEAKQGGRNRVAVFSAS